MSETTVLDILQQIEQLPDEDRLLLEKRLSQLAEREWGQAAQEGRRIARDTGIDQDDIDRAVARVRYRK